VRTVLQDIADTLPLPSGARASREMRSLAMLDAEAVPAAAAREAPPVREAALPPVADPGPRDTPPTKSRALVKVGVGAGALLLAAGVAVVLWLRTPAPAPAPAPAAAPVAAPVAVPVAESEPVKPSVAEPVTGPAPQPAPETVATEPAPAPAITQKGNLRASEPSTRVNTERKPPLLMRIARLERKLRASSLAPDEKEGARKLLQKVRARAASASTADERKQVKRNLDIWERQYLGN
jgi:eukaryotic-like serine/threonine-protein kinase